MSTIKNNTINDDEDKVYDNFREHPIYLIHPNRILFTKVQYQMLQDEINELSDINYVLFTKHEDYYFDSRLFKEVGKSTSELTDKYTIKRLDMIDIMMEETSDLIQYVKKNAYELMNISIDEDDLTKET